MYILWELELREAAIPGGGSLGSFRVKFPPLSTDVPQFYEDGTKVAPLSLDGMSYRVRFLDNSCAIGRVTLEGGVR